jgi:hypothetical protein
LNRSFILVLSATGIQGVQGYIKMKKPGVELNNTWLAKLSLTWKLDRYYRVSQGLIIVQTLQDWPQRWLVQPGPLQRLAVYCNILCNKPGGLIWDETGRSFPHRIRHTLPS